MRRLPVESSRPLRDPAAVLRLYRERLAALADPVDPGFGFDVMRLAALATDADAIGHAARARVLAAHTADHRAAELEAHLAEAAAASTAKTRIRK